MKTPWKVLVVDDDEGIHSITRMVFRGYEFEERPIELINASSGSQAKDILNEQHDIAVTILDVVMETDHEGLNLVTFIRNQLGNNDIRIILRTGHPGFAPEAEVIVQYDINDYLSKAELSASRLITSVVVALRSYRDIQTVKPPHTIITPDLGGQEGQVLEHFSKHLEKKIQPLLVSTQKLAQFKHKPMVSDLIDNLQDECQQLINGNTLLQPFRISEASQINVTDHLDLLIKSYLTQAKQENWIIDYEISDNFPEELNLDSNWLKTLLICLLEIALNHQQSTHQRSLVINLACNASTNPQQLSIEVLGKANHQVITSPWLSLLENKLTELSSFYGGDAQSKLRVNTDNNVLIHYSFLCG
jgi:CheY-like chemotaxis protein